MTTLHPDRVAADWLRSGSPAMFRARPEFPQPQVSAAAYAVITVNSVGLKSEPAAASP